MSSANDIGSPESSCHRLAPLLDDLVDDRLTEAQQVEVRGHLAICEGCFTRLGELERLLAAVDALPETVEPPQDLWPLIAPRLTAKPAASGLSPWPSWMQQAAAALMFMALGALLSQILLPGRESVRSTEASAAEPRDGADAEMIERRADFALAEADYLRAKESLWSAVYTSRETASPETRDVVERNLRVIDQAIRELRQALHDDPGNQQLENLLLSQHRTEIDLLQRLALTTSEI